MSTGITRTRRCASKGYQRGLFTRIRQRRQASACVWANTEAAAYRDQQHRGTPAQRLVRERPARRLTWLSGKRLEWWERYEEARSGGWRRIDMCVGVDAAALEWSTIQRSSGY